MFQTTDLKGMKYIWFWLIFVTYIEAFELQKAYVYKEQNITGWVMSEKYDGIRGYWDGRQMYSKGGYEIVLPDFFRNELPPFALDGELWIARGAFEKIAAIVLDEKPSPEWKQVTYQIFEVPFAKGDFLQRLQKVKDWIMEHHTPHLYVIKQIPCQGREHMQRFLENVVQKGGEGVMVKDPSSEYFTGRDSRILKVKKYMDMEGEVIAINPGRGKYKGMMGSVTVKTADNKRVKIGTGFTIEQRQNPPKVGEVITFKYHGYTKNGIPKFASFIKIRKYKTY